MMSPLYIFFAFLLTFAQWSKASNEFEHEEHGNGHEFPVTHFRAVAAAAPLLYGYGYGYPYGYGLVPFKNRKKAAHKEKSSHRV
ncbi:hypothetical protein RB195_005053 [Necator americanus]|uniref:Uncharacterized protein n=1 Tax=Necator americanus TaxID=51031 RepID=A0ABR1BPV8_NECAM